MQFYIEMVMTYILPSSQMYLGVESESDESEPHMSEVHTCRH